MLNGALERDVGPPVPPKTPLGKSMVIPKTSPLKLLTTKASPSITTAARARADTYPTVHNEGPKSDQGEPKHVRENSGDSIMDRGRPMKRNMSQTKRDLTGPAESSKDDFMSTGNLPIGMPAKIARERISWLEIRKLEHQAKTQAERFEVLQLKDVQTLSQVNAQKI